MPSLIYTVSNRASKVHPNFSVAKLKPYYPDRGSAQPKMEPIPEPDPDQKHEIEDILLHRGEGDKIEYLVRWSHFGPEDASWVKKGDIQADRLIKKYNARRKILREYNEAATTKEDAFVFSMLATAEATELGALAPRVSPESLLAAQEELISWCATTKHPYYGLHVDFVASPSGTQRA